MSDGQNFNEEALQEILDELRKILECPPYKSIMKHATELMQELNNRKKQ